MQITINAPNLEELKRNAKATIVDVLDKPVPLGKTVLLTSVAIGVAQIVIFRRYKVSVVLTKS